MIQNRRRKRGVITAGFFEKAGIGFAVVLGFQSGSDRILNGSCQYAGIHDGGKE